MIEHAVLLAVRPGTPEADVDAMLAGLRGLDGIDGVLSVSVGPTFTDRGKQFTHGLIVRLADRAALERYVAHPLHVACVNERIRPIIDDLIALDWEV
jgi:hypothetical protein